MLNNFREERFGGAKPVEKESPLPLAQLEDLRAKIKADESLQDDVNQIRMALLGADMAIDDKVAERVVDKLSVERSKVRRVVEQLYS